ACAGALTDEGDAAAPHRTVDGVLGARAHGDRHFAGSPAAAKRALEHGADGARLPGYLRVGGALRLAAEHHEKAEEAGHDPRQDPHDHAKDVAAREHDRADDAEQNWPREAQQHPPLRRGVVFARHLEDVVHLLYATWL